MTSAYFYQFTDEELLVVAKDIAQYQNDLATQHLIEELCDRLQAAMDTEEVAKW